MTLILSVIARDFVVQASDRRLTSFPTGQVIEDDANKAIFFCGQSAIAYTGLARIGGQPTDEWVLECLSGTESLWNGVKKLQTDATNAMRRMNWPWIAPETEGALKRIAFVIVGFTRFVEYQKKEPSPEIESFYAVVSNFLGSDGTWLASASRHFSLAIYRRINQPFVLRTAGALVLGQIERSLLRSLRKCFEHRCGPHAVGRILMRAVRDVSYLDQTVGSNIMVSILTRDGLTPGNPSFSSVPIPLRDASELTDFVAPRERPLRPQYIYSPHPSARLVYHGPARVCAGWMLKGLKFFFLG
jgi:hypothetical protein